MYERKAGVNWFEVVFYHNWTFIVAGLLALLLVNPFPGRSDIFSLYNAFTTSPFTIPVRRSYDEEAYVPPTPRALKPSNMLWALWQLVKWAVGFAAFTGLNGLPGLGNVVLPTVMMLQGFGRWRDLPNIFLLPLAPQKGSGLISLMPSMELQYRVFYAVLGFALMILAVRFFLKFMREFLKRSGNIWIRNLFLILSFIALIVLLGAPYWAMDATTPFDYIIVLTGFMVFVTIAAFLHTGLKMDIIPLARRRRGALIVATLVIVAILGVNVGTVVWYRFNWNNNWAQYEWQPLTQKQIEVTRWAAGLQQVNYLPLTAMPTGNVTQTLSLVRQWDQEAAFVKSKNQIGVNWMRLTNSYIVYVGDNEYWISPTTVLYPSTDWISRHLIYTHTSRVIVIDSHNGEFVSVQKAFGIRSDPIIYYGEGFYDDVYVHVKGFDEIENISYTGQADYVLSGWQRALWFLAQGQLGFAFSPPQENIEMLFNRDVFNRVGSILIYGLEIDPAAYLVSDGNNLYYAVQIYIDYPLHSGFTASNYLRFFAVVLIDVQNGAMNAYVLAQSDGFLVDFYRAYYPSWQAMPNWLVPQLRYPEQLLGSNLVPRGQLDVDFQFHVSDPFVWRSGSDFYERPLATEVLYIPLNIDNKAYFVGVQLVEFHASPGKNLAGLYLVYGGSRLGETVLYSQKAQTSATLQLIGPSAALQALETDEETRRQLTLLTNNRRGNILLYLIGGKLFYFIPVYVATAGTGGVITKMAFIGIIEATTGAKVAIGADSFQAYTNLVGTGPIGLKPVTGIESRINRILETVRGKAFQVVNVTKINANIEVQVGKATYLNEGQWPQTEGTVNSFLKEYAQRLGVSEVYLWRQSGGIYNLGVLASERGVMKLYYISLEV